MPTEEGGRQGPARGAIYRPACNFGLRQGDTKIYNEVLLEFVGCEWAAPGETVLAKLYFLRPDFQRGRLCEGFMFDVCEGPKIVGHGRITHIFDAALQKSQEH